MSGGERRPPVEGHMYIGIGTVAFILVVILIIYLIRRV
jgi:hypothetical protein